MAAFISGLAKVPLAFQPGERSAHGFNTDVLGAMVEKVSGTSFDRFVSERITGPPKMIDTGFDVPEAQRGRIATVDHLDRSGELVELKEAELAGVYAEPGRGFAAGISSTVDDYARFGQMLLNGGELDGARLLG